MRSEHKELYILIVPSEEIKKNYFYFYKQCIVYNKKQNLLYIIMTTYFNFNLIVWFCRLHISFSLSRIEYFDSIHVFKNMFISSLGIYFVYVCPYSVVYNIHQCSIIYYWNINANVSCFFLFILLQQYLLADKLL